MKLTCTECLRDVSTDVPDDTVVKAVLVCYDCVDTRGAVVFPGIDRDQHVKEIDDMLDGIHADREEGD